MRMQTRIQFLCKMLGICNHLSIDPQAFTAKFWAYRPPLWASTAMSLKSLWIFTIMRILIELLTLMWIRIQLPKLCGSGSATLLWRNYSRRNEDSDHLVKIVQLLISIILFRKGKESSSFSCRSPWTWKCTVLYKRKNYHLSPEFFRKRPS
jgi:hypothetical protein